MLRLGERELVRWEEQHNGIKTVIDQSDFTEETSPSCSYEVLQLNSRFPNLMLISLFFQVRDDQLNYYCLQIASCVVGLCKDYVDQQKTTCTSQPIDRICLKIAIGQTRLIRLDF